MWNDICLTARQWSTYYKTQIEDATSFENPIEYAIILVSTFVVGTIMLQMKPSR